MLYHGGIEFNWNFVIFWSEIVNTMVWVRTQIRLILTIEFWFDYKLWISKFRFGKTSKKILLDRDSRRLWLVQHGDYGIWLNITCNQLMNIGAKFHCGNMSNSCYVLCTHKIYKNITATTRELIYAFLKWISFTLSFSFFWGNLLSVPRLRRTIQI